MNTNSQFEYKIQILEVHLNPILTLARWKLTDEEGNTYKELREIVNYLNRLGEAGWELVNCVSGSDQQGTITKLLMFFKREKRNAVQPD
jgi:hypothetical protein|uniref:DUF4177 domain-containing protein n=1 Tax=candidate division WOR-3 bacterium TaxID=2052148 RepID=A0A7C3Z200_UNCW3